MEKCTCGREFETKAQLRGHQSHCRGYLGEEKYQERQEIQKKATSIMNENRTRVAEEKHQKELEEWYSQPRYCEYCGKLMKERYATGRFCNHSCSSGWVGLNQSDEAKSRKIEVGKKNLKHEGRPSESWTSEQRMRHSRIMSEVMNRPEVRYKISKISAGRTLSEETRKKVSIGVKRSHEEGRNKGWTTRRSQESYAEAFWRRVLDNNNIPYEQEHKVLKDNHTSGCYFLDFLLIDKNIDLEIDGHQHYEEDRKCHDKIRDEYLISKGFIVYRIKWVNPKNSLKVKEDIDRFLEWYNSIPNNS